MQEVNFIELFVEKFEKLGEPYMIMGSIASIIYGEPRLTHDIDIVITIKKGAIPKLVEEVSGNEFYLPPVEFLIIETTKEALDHFNIIHLKSIQEVRKSFINYFKI
ncbi:MAG: hypothetical protein ACPL25_00155 [Ignavibacteria bacterium]